MQAKWTSVHTKPSKDQMTTRQETLSTHIHANPISHGQVYHYSVPPSPCTLNPGIMGQGMAANLAKAGCNVVVWNRSEGKREAFVAEHEGSSAAATPREVLETCDLIYLMLSDLEASRSALPRKICFARKQLAAWTFPYYVDHCCSTNVPAWF